jgi:hypothetical protein
LSLQSQFITLPAFSKCIEIYDQFFINKNFHTSLHKISFRAIFFVTRAERGRKRDIVCTSWFMIALPTITILTNQVVCMLLYKAKAVIWKVCKSEIE